MMIDISYPALHDEAKKRMAATLLANYRRPDHYEVRRITDRTLYIQHHRTPEGGVISTHTDISRYADVIKAEQRLHSDFILAAETSRIGIWEWDLATDELQVNDALLLLLDIPRTNPVLSGSLWTQAFPADCLAHFTQSIRQRAGPSCRFSPAKQKCSARMSVTAGCRCRARSCSKACTAKCSGSSARCRILRNTKRRRPHPASRLR